MDLSQTSSVEILSFLSTLAAVSFVALYRFPGIAVSLASFLRRLFGLPSISLNSNSRRVRSIGNWAPLLGITLLMGSTAGYLYVTNQPNHEAMAKARSEFSRLTLPQAIAHCFAISNEISYTPLVAFAWQPQALDLYVLEGNSNAQMRHYSCDGTGGLVKGERYERVMLARVPPQKAEPGRAAPQRNLLDHYAEFSEANVLALQAALDPATGAVVERRWLIGGGVQSVGEDGGDFPVVLRRPSPGLAIVPYAASKVIVRPDWSRDPQAVFAVLEKNILPSQRVAKLYFQQDGIQVTVLGPIEVSGQPPANFGSMSFDAYGVAGQEGWTPAAPEANTCTQGRPLREVRELLFDKQPSAQKLLYASFGCDARRSPSPLGDWTLRNSDQRR